MSSSNFLKISFVVLSTRSAVAFTMSLSLLSFECDTRLPQKIKSATVFRDDFGLKFELLFNDFGEDKLFPLGLSGKKLILFLPVLKVELLAGDAKLDLPPKGLPLKDLPFGELPKLFALFGDKSVAIQLLGWLLRAYLDVKVDLKLEFMG